MITLFLRVKHTNIKYRWFMVRKDTFSGLSDDRLVSKCNPVKNPEGEDPHGGEEREISKATVLIRSVSSNRFADRKLTFQTCDCREVADPFRCVLPSVKMAMRRKKVLTLLRISTQMWRRSLKLCPNSPLLTL